MVTLAQVQHGLSRFIDNDMLPLLNGWQKWGFGTIAGLSLAKLANIFNELKSKPFVAALGIVDQNNMIDIDLLYKEVHKIAQQSPVTIDVPMIGSLTLNVQDIEKLYRYIKEA